MPDSIDNEHLRNLLRTTPGDAIRILYSQYAGSLRAIARKLTRDESAAEDIVQEAFVYVWRNAYQLGKVHEKSIQHYLVRVVRNRAITYYNESMKDEVRKNVFVMEALREAKEEPFEVVLILNENSQELRRLINTFPEREKQCLLLKLDDQMKNEQIASHLGITEKAVERSITSGYKRIRKHFGRE